MHVIPAFYGGIGEIGGNKFLLEHDNTKVFLDLGKNFDQENQYFDFPLLQPYNIPDYLKVGVLPEIKGLYRHTGAKPPVDAVLVTHPHVDHYAYIPLLDGRVMTYTGWGTKNIIEIRDETYRSYWDRKKGHLKFKTFRTGDRFSIGSIEVEPIHVDHSVPASYAFILNLGGKTLAYTGDLRMHGYRADLTEDFVRRLEEEKVDVMLCEGTNISPKREDEFLREFEQEFRRRMGKAAPKRITKECKSEGDVRNKMNQVVSRADGLVVVETSPADVDRIRTLWQVARENDRTLVLGSRQAYLVYELGKSDPRIKNLPTPTNSIPHIRRRSMKGSHMKREETYKKGREEFRQKLIEQCEPDLIIKEEGREELRKNPENYLLCCSDATSKFMELKSRKKVPCTFTLSKSEPFNEEMVIKFDKLLHWLALFGIERYHQIHVSGHCSREEIKDLVRKADPNVLFPVHTEHPELVRKKMDFVPRVIKAEYGDRYRV